MKKEIDSENERAYIKLEIPQPSGLDSRQRKAWEGHADNQEMMLIEMLKTCCMIIKSDSRSCVSEKNEEPCFESTFELHSPKFGSFVINAIERYLEWVKTNIPFNIRSTLVLYATQLFEQNITSIKEDLKLDSVHFGNLAGNEFYDHWEVSYLDERDKKKDEKQIFVNFEFDRPVMVSVRFKHLERNKSSTRNKIEGFIMHYQLKIHKCNIRRVICDTSHRDVHGFHRPRIYFELDAPVVIRKGRNSQNNELLNKLPRFDRELIIRRGSKEGQVSHPQALTDSRYFCIQFSSTLELPLLYTILSRFRCRANVPIEFLVISDSLEPTIYHEDQSPYHQWTRLRREKEGVASPFDHEEELFRKFLIQTFVEPQRSNAESNGRNKGADKMRERKFAYCYLIECLLSRGAVVKDQLLLKRERWIDFLLIICNHFNDDRDPTKHDLCEAALEDLIGFVDSRKRIGDLLKHFEHFCQERCQHQISNQMTPQQYDEGYRRVRKIVLTPTRLILIVPEVIMGNRVLNSQDHDSTRIVRVSFRDDDNMYMRVTSMGKLLASTVLSYLSNGISVAGRDFGYLGSSNSQMRDNGAYFMEKCSAGHVRDYHRLYNDNPPHDYKPKIVNFRKKLGKFEMSESIPKAMARFGQCFTQARVCAGVELGREDYFATFDVVGGKTPTSEPYKFTDGVGAISVEMATILAKNMKLGWDCVPSAYQIRFRGMKGMLAIDPSLDETYRNFKRGHELGLFMPPYNELLAEEILTHWKYSCVFRPSQIKFTSSKSKDNKYQIELVKYSTPTAVALNRPLINVLDHVSEKQSLECHRRICERIEELLDQQMASFSKLIINEDACRQKLEEMPRRIHFATLKKNYGFFFTTEPFFRSLIRASINVTLSRLLRKTQIAVPTHLGRSMFGVTDETGRLQYGQVFVQYTTNINQKTPSANAHKTILTGSVLITKCPSVVSGDVRVFEAVDIPELRHLNDVVVFPQHGPRSHPDEMAGSDLDGDEYSVIWDDALLFNRNEKAFNFSADKVVEEIDVERMDEQMHEFYVQYMEQDSVGTLSLNHLYLSDQFGIESKVCDNVAKKLSQALDFVKSGHPPAPIVTSWDKDEKTGEMIPPERSERIPDYTTNADKITTNSMYISSRLLGVLFRELKAVDDVMRLSDEREVEIELDGLLVTEGWEKYKEAARKELAAYNAQLRSIMENYGIQTEAEIFSGCILDMRNRISDQEQDNMSFFNTDRVVEGKMTDLYRNFRMRFFEEFTDKDATDGYMRITEMENQRSSNDDKNILRRVCKMPSNNMKRKAVAYYQVCYETAQETGERKLSFAWLAYDILNGVRAHNLIHMDLDMPMNLSNPLFRLIENHRKQFFIEKNDDYKELVQLVNKALRDPANKIEGAASKVIFKYWKKYPDLKKIFLIFYCWAKQAGVIAVFNNNENEDVECLKRASECRLRWYHLILLLIMFATRKIGSQCDLDVRESGKPILYELDQHGQILNSSSNEDELTEWDYNRLTVNFFQFLASRQFKRLRYLSFQPIGVKSVFMSGEWQALHKSGVKTYYNLLLNLRFEELPVSTDLIIQNRSVIKECTPFIVELPDNCQFHTLLPKLKRMSKCVEIQTRILGSYRRNTKHLVSARGSIESIQNLRELVTVKIPKNSWCKKEKLSEELAVLCIAKMTGNLRATV